MKKFAILTISLFIILPKLAGQEATLKPYGIKSGIIEYTYSGDKVGKGTLYFDDYGMKSAMLEDAIKTGKSGKAGLSRSAITSICGIPTIHRGNEAQESNAYRDQGSLEG